MSTETEGKKSDDVAIEMKDLSSQIVETPPTINNNTYKVYQEGKHFKLFPISIIGRTV